MNLKSYSSLNDSVPQLLCSKSNHNPFMLNQTSLNTHGWIKFSSLLLIISISLQAIAALFTDFTSQGNEAGDYWEPLHFLLYGKGIQTWTWCLEHALRSPVQLFVLSGFGKIFQYFGFSRYFVFYGIRLFQGTIGSLACYYFSYAVKKKFGDLISVICFLLIIFNYSVLFFMNRVNIDSTIAILNMFIFALWLENRVIILVAVSCFAVMLRPNYLPVFGIIFLQILLSWEERNLWFKEWALQLFLYCISVFLFWFGVFLAVDSFWYRQSVLSWFNFIYFNLISNQNMTYPSSSSFEYLDCFLRENNAVVFVGSIVGWWTTSDKKIYSLPYAIYFLYIQLMSYKQEKLVYFLYPIICLYCSICIVWLLQMRLFVVAQPESLSKSYNDCNNGPSNFGNGISTQARRIDDLESMEINSYSKKIKISKRNQRIKPLLESLNNKHSLQPQSVHAASASNDMSSSNSANYTSSLLPIYIVFFVVLLYVISGMSTCLLRVYQNSAHYYFYNYKVEALISMGNESDQNCLSVDPWVSWRLPLSCKRIYTIPLYDELFPVYNRASFRIFENPKQTALILLRNSSRMFIPQHTQSNYTAEIKRIHNFSKKVNFFELLIEKYSIDYIFIQGGLSIDNKTATIFNRTTNRPLRHSRQSTISYYYETLFGKYLDNNFELVVEEFPISQITAVSPMSRHLGLWLFDIGMNDANRSRVASLSLWRRKKFK